MSALFVGLATGLTSANLVEVTSLGTASQTSEWRGGLFPAADAVDGDPGTFSHTDASTPNNAWELTFASELELSRMELDMRSDCCDGRMTGAIVRAFDAEGDSVYAETLKDPGIGGTVVLDLPEGTNVERIRVGFENGGTNPGLDIALVHLAEVRVFSPEQALIEITSFTASSQDVSAGEAVTLTWDIENADEARLFPGGQVVAAAGSLVVNPSESVIYEIEASNSRGLVRENLGVIVDGLLLPLRINEFMASNDGALERSDGSTPDWIELWNPNPESVALSGYALSDEAADPRKFVFSEGEIGAGAYRVVDAASAAVDGVVATGFSLSRKAGEVLIFTGPDLELIESIVYPEQFPDVSYGKFEEGEERFSVGATPGAVNGGVTTEGFVEDTRFSVDRGFYTGPQVVEITTDTPEAVIFITSDGSEPGPENPSASIYEGPLTISTTTVLRAMGVRAGWMPTNVDTQTYLFADQVAGQSRSPEGFPQQWMGSLEGTRAPVPALSHFGMNQGVLSSLPLTDLTGQDFELVEALTSIPSISLAIGADVLLDPQEGLYENAGQRGRAWEREVSFEVIDPGRGTNVQVNAGLRAHGGWNRFREMLKKSFRLYFRSDYGDSELRYPMFPGEEVQEFDRLILRSGNGKAWSSPWRALSGSGNSLERVTYMRDQIVRDFQGRMGQPSISGTFMHLYINGHYWGVYNPVERPTEHFAASRFGGDHEEYDVIKWSRGIGHLVSAGDDLEWNRLIQLVRGNVLLAETFEEIQSLLDLENFVDYIALNHYAGNVDWVDNNVYAMRRNGPGEKFRFYCWDSEESYLNTTVDVSERTAADSCMEIHLALRAHPEYRRLFGDRVQRHFFNDGALTPGQTEAIFDFHASSLDQAIVAESARWGDLLRPSNPYERSDWLAEITNIRENYLSPRVGTVLSQFRSDGLYPRVAAPVFAPQHGGEVAAGTPVTLDAETTTGTIYYSMDGSDPREEGGAISGSAQVFMPNSGSQAPIMITGGASIMARVLQAGEWSALTEATFVVESRADDLFVSELMYHPAEGGAEFVEISNRGSVTHLLGDLRITGGIQFDFGAASVMELAPGERLLLVRDTAIFTGAYPGVTFAGDYAGGLGNGGDSFSLEDEEGDVLWTLTYEDAAPWPAGADGAGRSLVYVGGEANQPEAWRPSVTLAGNPGTSDALPFDGEGSLVEYAIAAQLVSGGVASLARFQVVINPGVEGVSMRPEWSTDLRAWAEEGVSLVSQEPTESGGLRQVWELQEGGGFDRLFFRMSLEER